MANDIPAVGFLTQCRDKAKSGSDELVEFINSKENGAYYLRYGFLEPNGSGISDDGKKIIEYSAMPENLIPLLADVLGREVECHGSWILIQKKYYNPQSSIYQFEANGRFDSSFIYASFLFDLGILEQNPIDWNRSEPHGYYRIPFSSMGKRIISHLVEGTPISPETKSDLISEQSQPTAMVTVQIDKLIIAPNAKQVHAGDGDNLQDSTKYQDVEEVKNE